jgi:hypothetical protein
MLGRRLLAGLGDSEGDELLGQLLKALMIGQGLLDGGHFVGGHVAGVVFALVPALEFEAGPSAGAAGLTAELAPLHPGEGAHLLEDILALLVEGHGKYLWRKNNQQQPRPDFFAAHPT